MSDIPPFECRRAFPFCIPQWTQAQCDNYQATGDPDTAATGTPSTTDPDGNYHTAGYGRLVDLTIQQAALYYWLTETVSVDLTITPADTAYSPRNLADDAIGNIVPLKRVCFDEDSASGMSGELTAGAIYPPPGPPYSDLVTFAIGVKKIAYNKDTELYEVYFYVRAVAFFSGLDSGGIYQEFSIEYVAFPSVLGTTAPDTSTLILDGQGITLTFYSGFVGTLAFNADSACTYYTITP